MTRIGRVRDTRLWPVRCAAAPLVAVLALVTVGCTTPTPPPDDTAQDVADLRAQIESLEFLGRLQLTDDQTAKLIAILQADMQARETATQRQAEARSALVPLLQQKRQALVDGTALPHETEGRIKELAYEIGTLGAMSPIDRQRLSEGLSDLLSDQQIRVAVGGLEARIQAAQMLDGYRDLPRDEFEQEMRDALPFVLGEGAEQAEALFREARTIADKQYEDNRSQLLDQLEPLYVAAGEASEHSLADVFARPMLLRVLSEKMQTLQQD